MSNFIFLTLVEGYQQLINVDKVVFFQPWSVGHDKCTRVVFAKDQAFLVEETQKQIAELIGSYANYKKESA